MKPKVYPEGNPNASIYLVGEALGRDEEIKHRLFIGGAGRVLDYLLREAGIRRDYCRIGNLALVRPPGNVFEKLTPEELEEGRAVLLKDIQDVNPNVVVLLGANPLEALTSEKGIGKWRGSVLWSGILNHKVIPTYHPAFIARQWKGCPLAILDLGKALAESTTRELHTKIRELIVAPTFTQVVGELDRLSSSRLITFDVETPRTSPRKYMTAIAFADSTTQAISIPFTRGYDSYWQPQEELEIMRLVAHLLEDPGVNKVAQNAQYDIGILKYWHGIEVAPLILDTMCAFHTCYSELPKDLGTLCSLYTDHPYYKHMGRLRGEDFWRYNALDACITFEVALGVIEAMHDLGTADFYYKHIHTLIPVLLEMQLRGMRVDVERTASVKETLQHELVELQLKLDEVAGFHVDVGKVSDVKKLLYERFHLPKKLSIHTGNVTTDEQALHELAEKFPEAPTQLVLDIRKRSKFISTYLDAPVVNGRMHCSYTIGGTVEDEEGRVRSGPETGRLSSSRSIIVGSGTNLQNIPHGDCRRLFLPDIGKILISLDLSQAEARVVAYIANEATMIGVFERGEDIHCTLASVCLGKPTSDITPEERTFYKRHVHALNYGEGPRQLAKRTGLPERDAREFMRQYFARFPNIRRWQEETRRRMYKDRTMVNLLGRKRIFFERVGPELLRQMLAHVPQSTVSDYLNFGMRRFHDSYDEAELLLQIHDGFVSQIDPGNLNTCLQALKEAFNIELEANGHHFYIPYKVETGYNWEDLVEVPS